MWVLDILLKILLETGGACPWHNSGLADDLHIGYIWHYHGYYIIRRNGIHRQVLEVDITV